MTQSNEQDTALRADPAFSRKEKGRFNQGELLRMMICPANAQAMGYEVGCLYITSYSAIECGWEYVVIKNPPKHPNKNLKTIEALPAFWFRRAAEGEQPPPKAA